MEKLKQKTDGNSAGWREVRTVDELWSEDCGFVKKVCFKSAAKESENYDNKMVI